MVVLLNPHDTGRLPAEGFSPTIRASSDAVSDLKRHWAHDGAPWKAASSKAQEHPSINLLSSDWMKDG